MALLEPPQDIVKSFYRSLRTESTLANYQYWINRVTPDPAAFLALADSNRWRAQETLIQWVKDNWTIGAYAIRNYISGVRALCNYAELTLNWKKVYDACPSLPRPKDEAPPIEAIQKIYDNGDLRFKALIHIFMAAPRLGAFDYFTMKDLEPLSFKGYDIGVLTVYRGQPEEYQTLVTDEGMLVIKGYFDYRKRFGEELTCDSPLIRTAFNPLPKWGQHSSVKALSSNSVKIFFRDAWIRAGYTSENRNWKLTHCFRKFLKTKLENTDMKSNFIELIEGHTLKLEGHYQKSKILDIAAQFVKYMPELYIKKESRQKIELKKKDEEISTLKNEMSSIVTDFRDELEELKKKIDSGKRALGGAQE